MSLLRLEGVRVIVTGGSRGLGRAVCEAYLREGASVVATAQRVGHLDALRRDASGWPGTLAARVPLDLGDPASVRDAAATARGVLGRIDVVVNNAAVLGPRAGLAGTSSEDLAAALAINVVGPIGLVRELVDALSDAAVIINVTSGAAGRARWGAYGLTKAALDTATRMLGEELGPRGVRVLAINPGGIRTQMRRDAHPEEDPAVVPHPRSIVEPFVAIAAGAAVDPYVEASEWTR
jgi:NAD(P)-dependent dehydrogenase (short-subunit alcohol dehydrogenase family)